MMRKLGICLLPAVLGLALFSGCSEEDLQPYFTRVSVDNDCGMAPLDVEFYGIVSGGNEMDEPTGANLYLKVTWDLGDGHTETGSLVHHTYEEPGIYEVTVTVEDADGDKSTESLVVEAKVDSMTVWAEFPGDRDLATPDVIDIYTTDAAHIMLYADLCHFNDDYSRFLFRWYPDSVDADRTGFIHPDERELRFGYLNDGPGLYRLIPSVQDIAKGIVRRDTVDVLVTPCPGFDPANRMTVTANASLDNVPGTPIHDVERNDVFTISFDADICGFVDEYYRFDVFWYLNTSNTPFSYDREEEFTFSDFQVGDGTHRLIVRVRDIPLGATRRDTLYFELTTP